MDNLYQHEPHQSLNLLKCFHESHHSTDSDTETRRKAVTDCPDTGTEWLEIMVADCRERLLGLPDGLAQASITSMPYHGSRDYGIGAPTN
jgi:hypothetical protein